MAKQHKEKEAQKTRDKVTVKIVRTKVDLASDLCLNVSMRSDSVELPTEIADALKTLGIIK